MGIAADLALALDPVLLAHAIGIEPDPWQARFLRSTSPRELLNCCRQSGKSTCAAVKAVHVATYEPGSLVLLLSPGLRQSQELFRKCLHVYHAMGSPIPPDSETKLTLELRNGSRIVSLPGKEGTVRGYSDVRLLIIDEASRVLDELYMSVRPMLAVSGGRLLAPSTPYGKRGWWYEAWRDQDEVWERYEIPATRCPRIPADFLLEEERALGRLWYSQEYGCQFIEAEGSLFSLEDIEGMFTEDIKPLFPTMPQPQEHERRLHIA